MARADFKAYEPPKSLAYFPFYPADWLTDRRVRVMNLEQTGAYITLLCYAWREGSIPAETDKLAALVGTSEKHFCEAIWIEPLDECWKKKRGGKNRLINNRLERERKRAKQLYERKSLAGIKGGRKGRRKPYTEDDWLAICEEVGNRCVRCGHECQGGPTKDHIVPRYRGGRDQLSNLQPLCRECNASKGQDTTDYLQLWRGQRLAGSAQAEGNQSLSTAQAPTNHSSSNRIDKKRKEKNRTEKETDNIWPDDLGFVRDILDRGSAATLAPDLYLDKDGKLDLAFLKRINTRWTPDPDVMWDEELEKYLDWLSRNEGRHKDRRRGFQNWLDRAKKGWPEEEREE